MLVQGKRKIKRLKIDFTVCFISLTMPKLFFVMEVKKFLSRGFTMVALYRIKKSLCLNTLQYNMEQKLNRNKLKFAKRLEQVL